MGTFKTCKNPQSHCVSLSNWNTFLFWSCSILYVAVKTADAGCSSGFSSWGYSRDVFKDYGCFWASCFLIIFTMSKTAWQQTTVAAALLKAFSSVKGDSFSRDFRFTSIFLWKDILLYQVSLSDAHCHSMWSHFPGTPLYCRDSPETHISMWKTRKTKAFFKKYNINNIYINTIYNSFTLFSIIKCLIHHVYILIAIYKHRHVYTAIVTPCAAATAISHSNISGVFFINSMLRKSKLYKWWMKHLLIPQYSDVIIKCCQAVYSAH